MENTLRNFRHYINHKLNNARYPQTSTLLFFHVVGEVQLGVNFLSMYSVIVRSLLL